MEKHPTQDQIQALNVLLTRRRLLQAAVAGGSAVSLGMLLGACGATTSSPTVGPLSSSSGVLPSGGASPSTGLQPRPGGSLIWGTLADAVTLAPFGVDNTSSFEATNLVYESLLRWDRNMEIQPSLAESYETPDDLTYVFHLRQGVKFHSGKELQAADVLYSFANQKDPPPPNPDNQYYPKIASVEAIDKYTVKLNMSAPDGTLPGYLAWSRYAYIVPEGLYDTINTAAATDGTGPFKITEYAANDHVTYEKNQSYWRSGYPYLDSIVFKVMGDEQSRIAALRSGAIDGTTISPDSVSALSGMDGLTVLNGPLAAFAEMQMTIKGDGKPWNDARVRQAVNSAIDRQQIIDNVYAGKASYTSHIPPHFGNWAIPDSELRSTWEKTDVAKAKELLAAAGYPDGFDVTLMAYGGNPAYALNAEVVKAQLAPIGINVTVQPLEAGSAAAKANAGDYEWYSTGRGMRGDPDGYMADFKQNTGYSKFILPGYDNPELLQLVDEGIATVDQVKRHEIYTKIQEIILTDFPEIPLVDPVGFQVVRNRVQDMYMSIDQTQRGLPEVWVAS